MPKVTITEQDIAEVPGLKELRDSIDAVEAEMKKATGRKKFLLKKQLIEMRQDQYVLRSSFRQPIYCMNVVKSFNKIDLHENITITEKGEVKSDGLMTLFVGIFMLRNQVKWVGVGSIDKATEYINNKGQEVASQLSSENKKKFQSMLNESKKSLKVANNTLALVQNQYDK